jgi:hypothetical protein
VQIARIAVQRIGRACIGSKEPKACPAKSLPSGLTWLDPRVGTRFAKKDMLNQKRLERDVFYSECFFVVKTISAR